MGQADQHNQLGNCAETPGASPPDAATIVGPEHAADSARDPSSRSPASEHLLYGIIALQNDLISREQLVAAFDAWVHDKSHRLADILESQGALSVADRQLADLLAARFIEKHGGDADKSLSSFGTGTTGGLERLNDVDLSASLGRLGRESSPEWESLQTHLAGGPSLGRFTILRPHAQGGLGQVSVALDQELNREVALKEIQPRHADNPVSRERFVLEAEITGGLEHPGIVPVYSLGQGVGGRPFYAMRFVRGESLKQAIDALHDPASPHRRDPGLRQVALRQLLGRFIAVCNAVEYAHSRGVLHRDLKPGNIMLGKYGETLVVDWGLAKSVDKKEIVSDEGTLRPASVLSSSGQTLPGSAIGTLSYMSPEQGAGRIDGIGPTSDVYSLGATLYHLLCGRPPFTKEDQASILDKLQRQDFPWPRAIAPDIDPALEAVCRKAMALKPADRYQTARALADDLERWLADEPVLALPETLMQRAARWTRRHRARAQAAAVALLAMTVVSVVAALLINQSRRDERAARLAASENEESAKENAQAALWNERLAEINAEAAQRNARLARDSAEKAQTEARRADRNAQTVQEQFRKTVVNELELGVQLEKKLQSRPGAAAQPELTSLRGELLTMVGDNLLRLGKSVQDAGITDFAMASMHDQMGELLLKLGRGTDALQQFEVGRRVVEETAAVRPDDDVARANLALLVMKIGRTWLDVRDDARAALPNFIKARDLQQAIMTNPRSDRYKPADNRRLLSMYEIQAGIAELRLGRPRPAQAHFQAALELRKAWLQESAGNVAAYSYLSECYLWLGTVAWHLEDEPGMESSFREALRICHELAERHPNDASFLGDLAEVYGSYGDAQLRLGKVDDARQSYSQSRDFLRRLMDRKRDDLSSLPLLAQACERDASVAERAGDATGAGQNYDQARRVRDRLAELDPGNLSWLAARALTLAHSARHAEAAEQAASLLERAPDNPSARLQAARCFAVCAQGEGEAGKKQQHLARALAAVEAAVQVDFEDAVLLRTDPDLTVLQDQPAFQSLLERLKHR